VVITGSAPIDERRAIHARAAAIRPPIDGDSKPRAVWGWDRNACGEHHITTLRTATDHEERLAKLEGPRCRLLTSRTIGA
jgi:hypothetical protein